MKLVIAAVLFITFECQGSLIVKSNEQTLGQAFGRITGVTDRLFDQAPVDELFQKSLNLTCIKDALKLDKIGGKTINENLTKWILAMASFQCMTNVQKTEFLQLFITNGFKVYDHEAGGHRCSKVLLHKTDPTSKMIENFDEDVDDVEVELCEQLLISDALDSIVDDYVGDFRAPDCKQMIKERQKKFMVVFLNLAVEDDHEVMENEMRRYVEVIKMDIAEVFECLMDKLTKN
jgi:hypothetical protein